VSDELTQAELEDFADHVADLAEAYGIDLTEDDFEDILDASLAKGFTSDVTAQVVGQMATMAELVAQTEEAADRLQRKIGRPLTREETETIAERLIAEVEEGEGPLNVEPLIEDTFYKHEADRETPLNLDTEAGRRAFYEERMKELEEDDEAEAEQERAEKAKRAAGYDPEDPEQHEAYVVEHGEDPPPVVLNLDNQNERHEFYRRALAGQEFSDVDDETEAA
jgi:hypothetical protein